MSKYVIGLMYDLAADHVLKKDDPKDKYAEMDNSKIARDIKKAISDNGYEVVDVGSFDKLLNDYQKTLESVDMVFNLTEGLYGRNRESTVPVFLDYFQKKYIGSDGLTMAITMDKYLTKKLVAGMGILTPDYFSSDGKKQTVSLKFDFPMIVKPRWEGSSKGIDAKAKVENMSELNARTVLVSKLYHQPVLVEKFIAGREFTVGLVGNGEKTEILPPLEIKIRGKEVGDRMYVGRYVYSNDVRYERVTEIDLQKELGQLSKNIYEMLECWDFGRVDFRMDSSGKLYFLELNPLPALSVQDAMNYAAGLIGWDFSVLIGKIIEAGVQRYKGEDL